MTNPDRRRRARAAALRCESCARSAEGAGDPAGAAWWRSYAAHLLDLAEKPARFARLLAPTRAEEYALTKRPANGSRAPQKAKEDPRHFVIMRPFVHGAEWRCVDAPHDFDRAFAQMLDLSTPTVEAQIVHGSALTAEMIARYERDLRKVTHD